MIIIVDVETVYDYPRFPPVEIVAARYLDGTYFNYVKRSVQNDGYTAVRSMVLGE